MEIQYSNKIHIINTIKNPPHPRQYPTHKKYNHNNAHTKQQTTNHNTTTPPSKHPKHQYTNTHPITLHKNPTNYKITIKTKSNKTKQTRPSGLALNQVKKQHKKEKVKN